MRCLTCVSTVFQDLDDLDEGQDEDSDGEENRHIEL